MNGERKPRCTECYHGLQAKTCLRSGKLAYTTGAHPRNCDAFVKKWEPSAPAATSIEIPDHGYMVGLAPVLGNPRRVLKPRFERQKNKPRMN